MANNDEKIIIKNIRVEYLSIKDDNFNSKTSYFKIIDKTFNEKIKITNNNFKLPWVQPETGKPILKVKSKYINVENFSKDETYKVDITFKYYKIEDNNIFLLQLPDSNNMIISTMQKNHVFQL